MPYGFARRDFYEPQLSNRYPEWGIHQRSAFGEGIVKASNLAAREKYVGGQVACIHTDLVEIPLRCVNQP